MASPGLHIDHNLDHQTRDVEIISILTVCCVLMTVVVVLRVYTRAFVTHSFGIDDWAIVIAQILAVGAVVVIGLEQHYGLGSHIWMVTDMTRYLQTFYSSILIYNASLVTVKISILLMYRRIFVTQKMRWATMIGLVILCAWGISLITSLAMICLPIQALWDQSVKGHCMPFVPAFFAPACINMVTDFAIFLLPLPAIRKLNLPRRQKIILAFILCLGLFTCVISIIRLCTLDSAATSPDSTWSNTQAALWSVLELTVAMVAACLPSLRPFVLKFFPRLIHSTGRDSQDNQPHIITWGSAGKVLRKHKSGDSTDQLYTETDIALKETLKGAAPVTIPPTATSGLSAANVPGYKVSVGSQNNGDESDMNSAAASEVDLARKDLESGNEHNIRATTVIKQEFERPDRRV